jgi:hypothetical protein
MSRVDRLTRNVYDAIETMDKAERTIREAVRDLRRVRSE